MKTTEDREPSLRQLARREQRTALAVLLTVRNVEPEALGCARRSMGFKQSHVAGVLGVELETIARWESGDEPFGRVVALAYAALIDRGRWAHAEPQVSRDETRDDLDQERDRGQDDDGPLHRIAAQCPNDDDANAQKYDRDAHGRPEKQ
jgi:DNA-binding transcriptional regulator YiaG